MPSKDFCEISIEIFLNMSGQVPFDVYIQLGSDKFTKISHRNDPVDPVRIENYFKKGARNLYILRKDRREYIGATERFIKKIIRENGVTAHASSRAVEELSEQTLYEIFEDHVFDEQSIRRTKEIVKSFVQMLKTDASVLTQFLQLCKHETYLVRHSISTSVFAILIARSSGVTNDRMLEIVGLGGMLHDVGMVELQSDLSDVDRKLSTEEWNEIKRHPGLGSKISDAVKGFPSEISLIIEQHHENWDGSGYPKAMRGEEIYYPARVVAIADCFSALTTRRGGRSLFSPEEALSLLLTEKHKYDSKLLNAFEQLLRPSVKKKTG